MSTRVHCGSWGYDSDGARHNCIGGTLQHHPHFCDHGYTWKKNGDAVTVSSADRCPLDTCKAPLPEAKVCPRNPRHTPAAWAKLHPGQQGIFPGLPRGQV